MTSKPFDALLCYDHQHILAVRELADALIKRGLQPWLDERELAPGSSWRQALDEIIGSARSAILVIGPGGTLPWNDPDMLVCLEMFAKRAAPIFAVRLTGASRIGFPPDSLSDIQFINPESDLTNDALDALHARITGSGARNPNATMRMLVDGYNLLHVSGLAERGPLARGRSLLLEFLAEKLSESERTETVIVFDGGPGDSSAGTREVQGMFVEYSARNDADERIEELILQCPVPRKLIVVSGDRRIQRAAKRRRAKPIDSGKWFQALQSRKTAEEPEKSVDPWLSNRRVAAFQRRFTGRNLDFACHAALPIALTPDLMYQMAAKFRSSVQGESSEAIADVLLSGLCRDQGAETYEMYTDVRQVLLQRLHTDERFGPPRKKELAEFLLAYVAPMSLSPQLDTRRFAAAQRAAALPFFDPFLAAAELAQTLAEIGRHDPAEQVRIARLVDDVSGHLPEADLLQSISRSASRLAHGDVAAAADEIRPALDRMQEAAVLEAELATNIDPLEFVISGVRVPISPRVIEELRKQQADLPHTRKLAQPVESSEDSSQAGRGQEQPSAERMVLPVWYATNRRADSASDRLRFTHERTDQLTWGHCRIGIPNTHRRGSIGSPWWSRLIGLSEDDRLKIESTVEFDEPGFWRKLNAALAAFSTPSHVVILINTFNMSFESMALRSAQVTFDLELPGCGFLYAWPSAGSVAGYMRDMATINASVRHLRTILEGFQEHCQADKIHVLGHSLGCQAQLKAIHALAQQTTSRQLGQVIFAAPDIDAEVFQQFAPECVSVAERITLYVSAGDKVLASAQMLNQTPRAGLTPPLTLVDGVDTVEVSGADPGMFGHTYYSSGGLLNDIRAMLLHNTAPEKRFGLRAVGREGRTYWKLTD